VTLVRGGRTLFEGLGLAVEPGEALQLTGPNGSGKSSLLRLAAGLLTTRHGAIERSDLALADDKPALDGQRPLGMALRFWSGRDPLPAMTALGIAHLADIPVRFLSSGQLRRASLARVVASGTRLWLLDEPANALDAEGLERLAVIIEDHRANGGAVMAATHQPLAGHWQKLDLGR
jgi:heme exporter protein A